VYGSIPIFYHFLNIAVVGDAGDSVISQVHRFDDGLVLLEELIVEQIKKLDSLQRHFHDHLYPHPEAANLLHALLTQILITAHEHPSKD
jgi:hypothetical protein